MSTNNNYQLEVEVKNLTTQFRVKSKNIVRTGPKLLTAVNNVSLDIRKGETLGLVGESGCGKTTLGKTILQLYKPASGQVIFEGQDLGALSKEGLRSLRRNMQIVFQDPYSSLNGRMTVGSMLTEPYLVHKICDKKEAEERARDLLHKVGLQPYHMSRYPHEFSGGQRQRISIARALTVSPRFIVCDEPVSALDVSVQAQIINLFEKIKDELNLTYLFIAHDLHVVRHISDRIGVMYFGNIVELGDEADVYGHALHPYTKALFAAAPAARLPEKESDDIVLKGEIPSLLNPPPGCPFSTRCDYCTDKCLHEKPELREVAPGHHVACHIV